MRAIAILLVAMTVSACQNAGPATGPVQGPALTAYLDRTFTGHGVVLNYRLQGEGSRALVCIHGVGSSLEAWEDVAARLGDAA